MKISTIDKIAIVVLLPIMIIPYVVITAKMLKTSGTKISEIPAIYLIAEFFEFTAEIVMYVKQAIRFN